MVKFHRPSDSEQEKYLPKQLSMKLAAVTIHKRKERE
jgi:hypothetical protein